eukprot:TRINITY_DN107571_c0_g1_i1.p1 TRINITY_DN107571_c0_g1~~TRINITY_DN107571_c0_g1_i1.p1  ORF type:complete len:194 (-),score=41.05 TRINITY_DN107571_c0_g1_i1:137-718(-)
MLFSRPSSHIFRLSNLSSCIFSVRSHPFMLTMFLPSFACVLPLFICVARANMNSESVGPSKHYVELEYDTIKKKMYKKDKDALIVFYSDKCEHCQKLHPYQEKAAAWIKKRTDKILFGRIDTHRELMARIVKQLGIEVSDTIPFAYFVKAETNELIKLDHSSLGWDDHEKLRDWIKEHTSFPDELKKKKQKEL